MGDKSPKVYAEQAAQKTGKGGCNRAERPRDCSSEAGCKTQDEINLKLTHANVAFLLEAYDA